MNAIKNINKLKIASAYPGLNFSSYIQRIKDFPILSIEEEKRLMNMWIKSKNLEAAHKLVTSHLKLVVKISLKFRNYGLPLMDVVSEGNIGLMKAVKKFKPSKGNRLSTYAMWWIKASIQDYIIKSWSIIKIGSGTLQKRLFSNISNIKNQIQIKGKILNKNKEYGILSSTYQAISLNKKLGNEGNTEFVDVVSSNKHSQEDCLTKRQVGKAKIFILKRAIAALNNREQDIISKRKLIDAPFALDKLSNRYKISSERVRQIEESALKKIKYFISRESIKNIV